MMIDRDEDDEPNWGTKIVQFFLIKVQKKKLRLRRKKMDETGNLHFRLVIERKTYWMPATIRSLAETLEQILS